MQALAAYINALSPDVEPIICLLVGSNDRMLIECVCLTNQHMHYDTLFPVLQQHEQQSFTRGRFFCGRPRHAPESKVLFWVLRLRLCFIVPLYHLTRNKLRPDLVLTNVDALSSALHTHSLLIEKIWQEIKNIIKTLRHDKARLIGWVMKVLEHLEEIEHDVLKIVKEIVTGLANQATGWNHAKFLAVNGTTAVVSGYNWWTDYGTKTGNRKLLDT